MNSALPIEFADCAAALAAGLGVGLCHFGTLRWNSRLLCVGHATRAVALQLLRVLLTAAALFMLARFGILSLIAGMTGFLLARGAAIRAVTRDRGDGP